MTGTPLVSKSIFLCCAVFLSAVDAHAQDGSLVERISLLSKPPAYWSVLPHTLRSNSDATHVLYAATRNNQALVVHDQVVGQPYSQIVGPSLSFDGSRFAYLGRRDNLWWLVIDGRTLLGQPPQTPPVFSPDSSRVAYLAQEGSRWFFVIDGKDGQRFDQIDAASLVFSPDSSGVAYVARDGDKWYVVENDQRSRPYDRVVGQLVYSPDSTRLAYITVRGEHWRVSVNNQLSKLHKQIGGKPVFSPDSSHLAYWAKQPNGRWAVVLDGKVDLNYEADAYHELVFSSDSSRLACFVRRGKHWRAVVDGRVGLAYDGMGLSSLAFSPDSKHVAYAAKRRWSWYMIKDMIEHPAYDQLLAGSVRFSPDSSRLAYGARRNGQWIIAVDGYEHRGFDQIDPSSIAFSQDGSKIAYVATADSKPRVVIDGEPQPSAGQVGQPVVSPDGSYVAWLSQQTDQSWRVMVNGVPSGLAFAQPLPGAALTFDSSTSLRIGVAELPGPRYQRLELRIQPASTVSARP